MFWIIIALLISFVVTIVGGLFWITGIFLDKGMAWLGGISATLGFIAVIVFAMWGLILA